MVRNRLAASRNVRDTAWAVALCLFLLGPHRRAEAEQLRFEPSCDSSKDMMGTSHRSLVTQAFSEGKLLLDRANLMLMDPNADRSPYKAWFGEWDWGNNVCPPGDVRRTVTKNVGLIRGAMMHWSVLGIVAFLPVALLLLRRRRSR